MLPTEELDLLPEIVQNYKEKEGEKGTEIRIDRETKTETDKDTGNKTERGRDKEIKQGYLGEKQIGTSKGKNLIPTLEIWDM